MVNYEATGTDWNKHGHFVTSMQWRKVLRLACFESKYEMEWKSAEPVHLVFANTTGLSLFLRGSDELRPGYYKGNAALKIRAPVSFKFINFWWGNYQPKLLHWSNAYFVLSVSPRLLFCQVSVMGN